MQSNGGLREHEDIILSILRDCDCRKSPKDVESNSSKLKDVKVLLHNQGELIDRLKSIEVEIVTPLMDKKKIH